ncbi:MAG: diacylglycerol kinase family protein [Nocardioides sp.]
MIDRPRAWNLGISAACFASFAVLAALVVHSWQPLVRIDDEGKPARSWAGGHDDLVTALHLVEHGFGSIAITILTVIVTALLLLRGQRRAAIFTAGVMIVNGLATTVLKQTLGRDRPLWQDPTGIVENHSFPSGHTSSVTAFCGVMIVLATLFVRRRNLRIASVVAMVVVPVVVGIDRILMGRHFPSDVVGGALLAIGVVFLGLAVYPPAPRSHAATAVPLVTSVPASTRDLHVILNPIKVEDVGQFRAIVAAMAAEAGWSAPTWHYTSVEEPGTQQAAAASVAGADLVMVCGGDGTVREVCAELAGTGIPVGIIPAGTGNLLARNLTIPLYLRSAIDVCLTGQDRAIDMVDLSGDGLESTHFMVMAGMGFDAAIMEGVNEDLKRRVGWVAYVLSGLKSLMFPAGRFEISVDGAAFTRHRARTVVVGNVGFLQAGLPLLPDAAIDDGLIDIVVLHPRNFFSWIPLAWRVLLKLKHTDELVNRMTGRTVVIRAAADTPRQLDGDSVGPGRELTMECVHGRLLVRVPR